jgi:hypothetical protein
VGRAWRMFPCMEGIFATTSGRGAALSGRGGTSRMEGSSCHDLDARRRGAALARWRGGSGRSRREGQSSRPRSARSASRSVDRRQSHVRPPPLGRLRSRSAASWLCRVPAPPRPGSAASWLCRVLALPRPGSAASWLCRVLALPRPGFAASPLCRVPALPSWLCPAPARSRAALPCDVPRIWHFRASLPALPRRPRCYRRTLAMTSSSLGGGGGGAGSWSGRGPTATTRVLAARSPSR